MSRVLVGLLMRVLETNKLKTNTFMYHFLRQQLLCLNTVCIIIEREEIIIYIQDDAQGFRWDPVIIHWVMTLQYHGGKKIIESIRGKSTQGEIPNMININD